MGRRKKPDAGQLSFIDESCPHHGAAEVCPACPGKLSTDGKGFVHPRDAAGRIPIRRCAACELYKPRSSWSLKEYFSCRDCAVALNKERMGETK